MVETLSHWPGEYTGTVQPQLGERDEMGQLLFPYLPSQELIEAVNIAIYLQRPLLIKGEPGCGKTELARAVAYELKLPFEVWCVKSTSLARDGLYLYDAVGRLRDAQLAANKMLEAEDIPRISEPATYVKWGPLGRAFRSERPTVVLIDEIDKADIDFPNDLLMELDRQWFRVEETGEMVRAAAIPIVFITSNDEKDLPDAFLRRCLFHYIQFPSEEQLIEIINAHFDVPRSSGKLVNRAVERFLMLRSEMQKDKTHAGKRVSTSELLDWFKVLCREPEEEALAKLNGTLPYPGVLLKRWDDRIRYL
ncbi:MAG: MoxR family ATPase [Cyanobacteriota bacterium]|nr:MoxR family ATPase [Cyanobacteriota bacterium]